MSTDRFQFIGEALRGDGRFRPVVVDSGVAGVAPTLGSATALVRYSREDDPKFARRNAVAFYTSPLARAVSRFVGYLFTRSPKRELANPLFARMAEDINGRGDSLDAFWMQFARQFKARGSMLLLVDMPREAPRSLGEQIQRRLVPYWSIVKPEQLTEYQMGDDGKFDFASFSGLFDQPDGERVPCTWTFDRDGWEARDQRDRVLASGQHGLGECPLLAQTEGDEFPCFGPFSAIADIGKRLFNAESELDEILRGQTFSVAHMKVPETWTEKQKIDAATTAGITLGVSNMLLTSDDFGFVAPPDGPATIYMERIRDLREQIDEIALEVRDSGQAESGEAKRLRFQALNGELAAFAGHMESIERRAWELSAKWLGLTQALPTASWSRDYNITDVAVEMQLLADMRDAGMPREVLVEQQRRIVTLQFGHLSESERQPLIDAVDAQRDEVQPGSNVIPLDRNADLRAAVVGALNAGR